MSISSLDPKQVAVVPPECTTAALDSSVPIRALRRQTTGAFTLFHLLIPVAFLPWFFSWAGVASVVWGNYLFGSVGICLCYHRILTHGSVKLPKWLEYTFAIFGICSLQDSPAHWVAIHRLHHKHSDHDDDPHSPRKSLFWSHVGWLLTKRTDHGYHRSEVIQRYAPDLMSQRFYQFVEKGNVWVWIFVTHAALFFLAGFLMGWSQTGNLVAATKTGTGAFLWGVVMRVVVTWHFTWSVNSLAHVWGYRNYETRDDSRNNWLVALVTWGEGWHNNHHADQRSAAHGHRWWEIDLTYTTIRILKAFGLARDIVEPRSAKPGS
ncbi:MAG: fatty acid desaturase [Planctomycetaceae bacterium]|nr:fatty acid desaturase [Planctomycetaceae bacterium]